MYPSPEKNRKPSTTVRFVSSVTQMSAAFECTVPGFSVMLIVTKTPRFVVVVMVVAVPVVVRAAVKVAVAVVAAVFDVAVVSVGKLVSSGMQSTAQVVEHHIAIHAAY